MFGIGAQELVLLLMLIVIFLGANRLPEIGRSLGEAMRELRKKRSERDSGEPGDAEERRP